MIGESLPSTEAKLELAYLRRLQGRNAQALQAAVEYVNQCSVVVTERVPIQPKYQEKGIQSITQSVRRLVIPGSEIVAGVNIPYFSTNGVDHSKDVLVQILVYTFKIPTPPS